MSIDARPIAHPLLALIIAWSGVLIPPMSEGAQFHFVAQELDNQQAGWSPREVVIHEGQDLDGEILFVLDNPTKRTHVFEALGLLERTAGNPGALTNSPLRVTVAPGDTIEVPVMVSQPEGEPHPCVDGEACYHFFCPLHRGDDDPGGTIRVVRCRQIGDGLC